MENLSEIFKKNNIILNNYQIKQFDNYFDMLIETNKYLNLTAITDRNDVNIKHFLDSVLPYKEIPENAKIVDVGTGAGFPSIPLKILREDLDLVMVDSLNKRVNFLNEVIKNLELRNCKAIHSRAEDFAKDNREKFDIVVARAVAPLNTLVEYLLPLVKIQGKALIYKSNKLDEELKISGNAIKILGAEVEDIKTFNIEDNDRKILVLKKIKNTPLKYPRDKNKPRLSPII